MSLLNAPIILLSILSAYSFILVAAYAWSGIYALRLRRYVDAGLSFVGLTIDTFFLQLTILVRDRNLNKISAAISSWPLWVYILILVLLTGGVIALAIILYRWNKKHISPSSFIDCYNSVNEGVLYYDDNGICLLVNQVMIDIANDLTNKDITNGNDFYSFVGDNVVKLKNNKTYSFKHHIVEINKRYFLLGIKYKNVVHELIANDISEIVLANERLASDNEKIKNHNKALIAYNEDMQEEVRRSEILSAKINIHDQMNHLMLSTMYLLDKEDEMKKKEVLALWKNNALLLCKEAGYHHQEDISSDLHILGSSLGIELSINGIKVLNNVNISQLFVQASKEIIINAVKHGHAKQLEINLQKSDDAYVFTFTNDGENPEGEIKFGGGLSLLNNQVKKYGGKLIIANKDEFVVRIEVNSHEI